MYAKVRLAKYFIAKKFHLFIKTKKNPFHFQRYFTINNTLRKKRHNLNFEYFFYNPKRSYQFYMEKKSSIKPFNRLNL